MNNGIKRNAKENVEIISTVATETTNKLIKTPINTVKDEYKESEYYKNDFY